MSDEDAKLSAQQLGALLGKKARRVEGQCLQCQSAMPEVTVRRVFCSARCRQKHWRTRLYGLKPGESMPYVTGHRPAPRPEPESDAAADRTTAGE